MRTRHWIGMLSGIVLASLATQASAQTSGQTFHWLGDVEGAIGDVTNGGNWLQQPDPDTNAVPGPQDYLVLRWGDRAPNALEYGAADATYEHLLFNHADVGTNRVCTRITMIPRNINGTGTLTFTQTGGPENVNVKSIESQGGHRLSIINPNVVSHGLIEVRNGQRAARPFCRSFVEAIEAGRLRGA